MSLRGMFGPDGAILVPSALALEKHMLKSWPGSNQSGHKVVLLPWKDPVHPVCVGVCARETLSLSTRSHPHDEFLSVATRERSPWLLRKRADPAGQLAE